MVKDELKIIQCDKKSSVLLMDILEIEPKCSFCGTDITEDNFGGLFPPMIVCCDSICCIMEAVPFEG